MSKEEPTTKALALANEKFSSQLHQKIAGTMPEDNLIMSSYSVNSVLGMVLQGAEGQTKAQLLQALALEDLGSLKGHSSLIDALTSNENVNVANRVYVSASDKFQPSFVEANKANFKAEPVQADFSQSEAARKDINSWVESQTNNRIKDLIASGVLSEQTKMVLVNAIYFKGMWAKPFDPEHTTKQDFNVKPGVTVKVDMMHKKARFPYAVNIKGLEGAHVLSMPYKGEKLSMVFVLPDEGQTLSKVEELLKGVNLGEVFNIHGKVETEVSIPKFKIESSLELNEPLKALGMTDMFDMEKADFSGMTGGRHLYVSSVIQKAFIEVNEEGAEAAAATAGIMMMRAMAFNPTFVCDRPFLFLIRDDTSGVTLFSGRVTDPTK